MHTNSPDALNYEHGGTNKPSKYQTNVQRPGTPTPPVQNTDGILNIEDNEDLMRENNKNLYAKISKNKLHFLETNTMLGGN